ncbi:hypothetical protein [Marinobacter sp. OP 3.4]|uniref:hypothetical protein n=1 Tax=Marinobacter sp. OP 3.4 TaxID=3076501 RepID=UPI002E1FF31A
MRTSVFGLTTLLLVSACSASGTDTGGDDFGAFTRELNNYDEVMTESRPSLQFSDGATAHSCREYLELRRKADVLEGVENRSHLADYRVCDTLQALKSAAPVQQPYRPDVPAGEVLRNRLDLRSFRSSLGPASSHYHTLAEISGELPVQVDDNTVTLESDDWYIQLEVVARADVDNDGHEDWLIWLTDEAREGNYRGYDSLVIHNVAGNGLLEASPIGP